MIHQKDSKLKLGNIDEESCVKYEYNTPSLLPAVSPKGQGTETGSVEIPLGDHERA
jgi:hypothetical protein